VTRNSSGFWMRRRRSWRDWSRCRLAGEEVQQIHLGVPPRSCRTRDRRSQTTRVTSGERGPTRQELLQPKLDHQMHRPTGDGPVESFHAKLVPAFALGHRRPVGGTDEYVSRRQLNRPLMATACAVKPTGISTTVFDPLPVQR
jgi:hypothetical protein